MYLNPKPTTREASVYLFRWKNKDHKELEPVQWESDWTPPPPFNERRGRFLGQARRHTTDRRSRVMSEEVVCWLPGKARKEHGSRQRKSVRCTSCGQDVGKHADDPHPCPKPRERRNPLRCELCRVVFDDRFALYAHLPCRANSEMVSEGLADRIHKIRRRDPGVLQSQEKKDFCEILDASLSGTVFKLACESGDFRRRNEESEEQKFQRFRTGKFCQFLACIRPELIHSKSPASKQLKEAGRIQREYFRSASSRQEAILWELFFGPLLAEMAKRETPGRPPSTLTENAKVKDILEQYEGEKAIAKLQEMGEDVPTEKKARSPWLRKLRNYWRVRSNKRVTSSRKKL